MHNLSVNDSDKLWCWERDSNPRRQMPADLQSALVGRLSIPAMEPPVGYRARYARTPSCDARQEHVNTFLTSASRSPNHRFSSEHVEPPVGFEPTTHGLQNRCSSQLS